MGKTGNLPGGWFYLLFIWGLPHNRSVCLPLPFIIHQSSSSHLGRRLDESTPVTEQIPEWILRRLRRTLSWKWLSDRETRRRGFTGPFKRTSGKEKSRWRIEVSPLTSVLSENKQKISHRIEWSATLPHSTVTIVVSIVVETAACSMRYCSVSAFQVNFWIT